MSKKPMPQPSMLYSVRAAAIVHGSGAGGGGAGWEFFVAGGMRVLVISAF
jgi:hypothetical protein